MYAASLSPRWLDDALPDRVELDAELLDVLGGEVGDGVVVSVFFCRTVMDASWWLSWGASVVSGQWSRSHAPAAAVMQVWMRTPSPGAAVVISPVRRSRTAPSRIGSTQP